MIFRFHTVAGAVPLGYNIVGTNEQTAAVSLPIVTPELVHDQKTRHLLLSALAKLNAEQLQNVSFLFLVDICSTGAEVTMENL